MFRFERDLQLLRLLRLLLPQLLLFSLELQLLRLLRLLLPRLLLFGWELQLLQLLRLLSSLGWQLLRLRTPRHQCERDDARECAYVLCEAR